MRGRGVVINNTKEYSFVKEAKSQQHEDLEIMILRGKIPSQKKPFFEIIGDEIFRY